MPTHLESLKASRVALQNSLAITVIKVSRLTRELEALDKQIEGLENGGGA